MFRANVINSSVLRGPDRNPLTSSTVLHLNSTPFGSSTQSVGANGLSDALMATARSWLQSPWSTRALLS